MPRISIAIPYHPMKNHPFFLKRLIDSIYSQAFTDYEIIIATDGLIAENSNKALRMATGELVKIIYLDDYFTSPNALQEISDHFESGDKWLVSGCVHDNLIDKALNPHLPYYNDQMWTGANTIGSPSVLTIRRDCIEYFDENLQWLLDCDLYTRLYAKYGLPKILNTYNVTIGLGDHQLTNKLRDEVKQREYDYLREKYS